MKKILIFVFITAAFIFGRTDYNYSTFPSEIMIQQAAEEIVDTQKKLTQVEANHIAKLVYDETLESPLDFSFVLAIIKTESRFNVNAKSSCGAIGLMQIMPKTFESIAKKHDLPYTSKDAWEPEKNIKVGVLFLESLYRRFGNLEYVSAGYNGGPGTANKYIKMMSGEDVAVPSETLNYVEKVKKHHSTFKNILKPEMM